MAKRAWRIPDEKWEVLSDLVDWGPSCDELIDQVRRLDYKLAAQLELAIGEKSAVVAESSFFLGLSPTRELLAIVLPSRCKRRQRKR